SAKHGAVHYGPEFIAEAVRDWIKAVGAEIAYIELRSSSENSCCENFNRGICDELLNGDIFYALREAQIISEGWKKHYNLKRPQSAYCYQPPTPKAIIPIHQWPIMH
ncbi:MAG: integrase core domain-containing protein, partial [Pikeienuella sp.]